MSLSFDEDLQRREVPDDKSKVKNKKNNKRKSIEEPSQLQQNERKKIKKELMLKTREEVFILPKPSIASFFLKFCSL